MAHTPAFHILDNTFAERDRGLTPPARRPGAFETPLGAGTAVPGLRIRNLDRKPPPGYRSGSYPRSAAYNGNVFDLTPAPAMPPIDVQCDVVGFDPHVVPILWRLQCRSVICRHSNQGNYRYGGACEVLDLEWQGRARAASFRLFDDRPAGAAAAGVVSYDHNSPAGPVMGGDAILTVAAFPAGRDVTLCDYVHLRIRGQNPGRPDVLGFLDGEVAARSPSVRAMLEAVFAHEASFRQFAPEAQQSASVRFRRGFGHTDPDQPDCRVRFDWPDDPPGFPLASFDFGVGISQWTRVGTQRISAAIAWDWRANVRIGANRMLRALRQRYQPALTWQRWAWAAWHDYNGAGPQADAYANARLASPEGQRVSRDPVPPRAQALAQAADLPPGPTVGPAPAWPPPPSPSDGVALPMGAVSS